MNDRTLGVRLNRANVLVDLALHDDAYAMFRQIISQSQTFLGIQTRAYLALAHALSLQGCHGEAAEVLGQALSLDDLAKTYPGYMRGS
jgi:hypothetical protein